VDAAAFFPRTFFGGEAFFSFCAASSAEVRPRAAYKLEKQVLAQVLQRIVQEKCCKECGRQYQPTAMENLQW